MCFRSPSLLKDCLAKNTNINEKLFSQILHCLLLSLAVVEKFCQSDFPSSGVICLISACCSDFLFFLDILLIYHSVSKWAFFLFLLFGLHFVCGFLSFITSENILACSFQIFRICHSSFLLFWDWLNFVDLIFLSSLSLVHLLISWCGVLHNF